jgi:mannonate dehydratase
MEQTWRWYGENDPITLRDARQAGATGIVTALHDLTPGLEWPVERIEERRLEIEAAGLRWSVVESVNVSEDIKKRTGHWKQHVEAYCATLRNLAQCGIRTVCYNFMPVLDWLRTDLEYALPDGALALRFDAMAVAAFDLFLLKRPGAEADWSEAEQKAARELLDGMSGEEVDRLSKIILAGLPGTKDVYSLDYVRHAIAEYAGIGRDGLRANLGEFLRAVCPTAEEVGVRMCIHPDDPPRSLLGLPRIASTKADFEFLLQQTPETANGITFCSGSLGARPDNDLVDILKRVANRVYFVHLRSTKREAGRDAFYEAPHLAGDVNIVALMKELVREQRRRAASGDEAAIPFRADHGNKILTDLERPCVPGYPAVGRLKGLAELRGVLTAVEALT